MGDSKTAVALLDCLRLSCVGDDQHNLGLTRGNVGLNRYNVDQSRLDFDTTRSNTGCTYRCNTGSYLPMQHRFVRGDVAPVSTNRCNAGGGTDATPVVETDAAPVVGTDATPVSRSGATPVSRTGATPVVGTPFYLIIDLFYRFVLYFILFYFVLLFCILFYFKNMYCFQS